MISVHGDPLARLGAVQAGGQNVYVRELAYGLARNGYEVDVATHHSSSEVPAVVEPIRGVRVLRFDAGECRHVPKDQMPELLPAFTDQLATYLEACGQIPWVIHSNYWISGLVGMNLRQRWGIPQCHTFHSLGKVRVQAVGDGGRRGTTFRITSEQALLNTADATLVSNPVEAGLIADHYRVDKRKLCALSCGVNPELFFPRSPSASRKLIGLPDHVRPLFFAGRFEANKGLNILLEALAQVLRRNPNLREQLHLLVAGGNPLGGPISHEGLVARSLVAKLDIKENVTFLGSLPQADLPPYFGAAVATVVSSYYETFGLVALEAIACGCPVVASRTGGLSHTVRHGENGLLVPPGDAGALAEAIESLYCRPGLAARLRSAVHQGVPRSFTWPEIARQAGQIYQDTAAPYEEGEATGCAAGEQGEGEACGYDQVIGN